MDHEPVGRGQCRIVEMKCRLGWTLPFSPHQVWEQIQKQNLHVSSTFRKHTNCQPVNQLPDGRQMSLGSLCQISIAIGWNSIGWNKWMLPYNSVQWNCWSIANHWTSLCEEEEKVEEDAETGISQWIMADINHCLSPQDPSNNLSWCLTVWGGESIQFTYKY